MEGLSACCAPGGGVQVAPDGRFCAGGKGVNFERGVDFEKMSTLSKVLTLRKVSTLRKMLTWIISPGGLPLICATPATPNRLCFSR